MSEKPNLDDLERLAKAAGGEAWQQGQLLQTSDVRQWSREQVEEAAQRELVLVFRGFRAGDRGCSRKAVAQFRNPEQAAYAAGANPAAVLELIAELKALRTAGQTVLNGLNARIDDSIEARRATPIFEGIAELQDALHTPPNPA